MKKISIKTALKLFPVSLAFCFVASFFGGCLYAFYCACTHLVAGQTLGSFPFSLFLRGILLSLPFVLAINGIVLILYLIRRPAPPLIPLIFYVLIVSLTWIFLIPLSWKFYDKMDAKLAKVEKLSPLSSGYFRNEDDLIYYYSKVNDDGTCDGICLDPSSDDRQLYTFSGEKLISRKSSFNDSLIETSVQSPFFIHYGFEGINILASQSHKSVNEGFGKWLCFASFGLALLSLIGMRRISSWRMLNVFFVLAFSLALFVLNALYYGTSVFANVAPIVDLWYKGIPFLKDAFIVSLNVLIALVFFITGLLLDLLKKNKDLEDVE